MDVKRRLFIHRALNIKEAPGIVEAIDRAPSGAGERRAQRPARIFRPCFLLFLAAQFGKDRHHVMPVTGASGPAAGGRRQSNGRFPTVGSPIRCGGRQGTPVWQTTLGLFGGQKATRNACRWACLAYSTCHDCTMLDGSPSASDLGSIVQNELG